MDNILKTLNGVGLPEILDNQKCIKIINETIKSQNIVIKTLIKKLKKQGVQIEELKKSQKGN